MVQDLTGKNSIEETTNSPANNIAPKASGEAYSFERVNLMLPVWTGYKVVINIDGIITAQDLPEVKQAMEEIIVDGGFTITQDGQSITGFLGRNLLSGQLINDDEANTLRQKLNTGTYKLKPKERSDLKEYNSEKSKKISERKSLRPDKPIDIQVKLVNSGTKGATITNPVFVLTNKWDGTQKQFDAK